MPTQTFETTLQEKLQTINTLLHKIGEQKQQYGAILREQEKNMAAFLALIYPIQHAKNSLLLQPLVQQQKDIATRMAENPSIPVLRFNIEKLTELEVRLLNLHTITQQKLSTYQEAHPPTTKISP